jgi:multiple sugar transport system substrate-binding protein
MGQEKESRVTRREFLKTSAVVSAGAGLTALSIGSLFQGNPALAADAQAPVLKLEKDPVIKVLRWSGFVKSDEEIWNANSKKWEAATGGKVVTEYLSWEDVRSKAAMEASVGAGHDIVLGWYDDPQLYPNRLIDVSDLADYLGKKYGGWYPVCEKYGREAGANRWIALPIGAAGICINYRVSWVKEAGFEAMPTDIEGFIKCCKALKAKNHPTGFALGHAVGDANSWTHWWLWSFGGKAVEADGKTIAINSKETLQALDASREFYESMISGVGSWLDPHNNKAFLAGQISATANGNSIFYVSKEKFPEINQDLMTMNYPVGPVGHPAELSMMSQAFIFKHTQFPSAAKHYLMFMFEEPQYGEWESGTWGYVTQTLQSYYDLPAWKKDPRITPYRECVKRMLWNGYAGAMGPASAAAMSEYVVVDLFADVCVGGKSPKTAILSAEGKLKKFYGA